MNKKNLSTDGPLFKTTLPFKLALQVFGPEDVVIPPVVPAGVTPPVIPAPWTPPTEAEYKALQEQNTQLTKAHGDLSHRYSSEIPSLRKEIDALKKTGMTEAEQLAAERAQNEEDAKLLKIKGFEFDVRNTVLKEEKYKGLSPDSAAEVITTITAEDTDITLRSKLDKALQRDTKLIQDKLKAMGLDNIDIDNPKPVKRNAGDIGKELYNTTHSHTSTKKSMWAND